MADMLADRHEAQIARREAAGLISGTYRVGGPLDTTQRKAAAWFRQEAARLRESLPEPPPPPAPLPRRTRPAVAQRRLASDYDEGKLLALLDECPTPPVPAGHRGGMLISEGDSTRGEFGILAEPPGVSAVDLHAGGGITRVYPLDTPCPACAAEARAAGQGGLFSVHQHNHGRLCSA